MSLIPGLPPPSPTQEPSVPAVETAPVSNALEHSTTANEAELKTNGPTESEAQDVRIEDVDMKNGGEVNAFDAVKSESTPGKGNSLAFDADFIEAARANRNDPEAEFAEDSDPEDSDDTTTSESDDTDSDDSSDYGSVILDPAEAARMLMRAGEDDEGGSTNPPRTANEQLEKPLPIPVIANIAALPIRELGHVSMIIPTMSCIVVRATIHAQHNVLQPGSVLCLADKKVIRPISDTIAQVQEPYYISYYETSDEITAAGIEMGTAIYYIDDPQHRQYVFYEELRKMKFTDASNINDEEVDDRDIEFSDDEAEAAWKKAKKEEKRSRYGGSDGDDDGDQGERPQQNRRGRGGRGDHRGRGRGGRGGRGGWIDYDRGNAAQVSMQAPAYSPALPTQSSNGLDYGDDGESGGAGASSDGNYNKLQRPDDYGTWSSTPAQPQPPPNFSGALGQSSYVPPASYSNLRDNQRDRGRGRGSRGHRGNQRGNSHQFHHAQPSQQQSYQTPYSAQASPSFLPPRPPGSGNAFLPPRPPSSGNAFVPPPPPQFAAMIQQTGGQFSFPQANGLPPVPLFPQGMPQFGQGSGFQGGANGQQYNGYQGQNHGVYQGQGGGGYQNPNVQQHQGGYGGGQ